MAQSASAVDRVKAHRFGKASMNVSLAGICVALLLGLLFYGGCKRGDCWHRTKKAPPSSGIDDDGRCYVDKCNVKMGPLKSLLLISWKLLFLIYAINPTGYRVVCRFYWSVFRTNHRADFAKSSVFHVNLRLAVLFRRDSTNFQNPTKTWVPKNENRGNSVTDKQFKIDLTCNSTGQLGSLFSSNSHRDGWRIFQSIGLDMLGGV